MDNMLEKITFTQRKMTLHFADGRKLTTQLAWYPRLLKASAKQRAHWEILGNCRGIHWPEIDEDLSMEGLLRGEPSVEYGRNRRKSTSVPPECRI